MGKILDFEKLKNLSFKRKKGRPSLIPSDIIIHMETSGDDGITTYYIGPDSFMSTELGKKILLERLFSMIAGICTDDPSIGLECYELLANLLQLEIPNG